MSTILQFACPANRNQWDDGPVRVLVPLPDRDFDVTEVAVPWRILRDAGHEVVFATERAGTVPAADPRLLTGVLFGQLGAAPEAKARYYELVAAPEFSATVAWAGLDPAAFDGLILPGGHAPGMRQYLGSPVLSEQVGRFWRLNRPVGAICHGVLVLARTHDPATRRSVLADRLTTCLPKYMERSAYLATAWRLGRYYRTYPAYVEDEVKAALDHPAGGGAGEVPRPQAEHLARADPYRRVLRRGEEVYPVVRMVLRVHQVDDPL